MGAAVAVIPLIVQGIGMIASARASSKAAKQSTAAGVAARQASESVAGLHEYNAAVSRMQAADAIERGKEEEDRFRQGINLLIGTQRAQIAANNIDVGYGSAVDVQADAAFLGELDALTIRTNAAREAWGYNVQSTDYQMRADIARREGVNLEAAGAAQASLIRTERNVNLLTGVASIVGGASSLAGRYGFGGGGGGGGASTKPAPVGFRTGAMSGVTFKPVAYSGGFSMGRGVSFR